MSNAQAILPADLVIERSACSVAGSARHVMVYICTTSGVMGKQYRGEAHQKGY